QLPSSDQHSLARPVNEAKMKLRLESKKLITLVLVLWAGLFVWASSQTNEVAPNDQSSSEQSPPTFTIVDLGTLGGNSSMATAIAARGGSRFAGMIVGTSTPADNTSHAFLFSNGQMLDLNTLCDLSSSDFAVLTAATSIDNAGCIVGEGVTLN